MSVVRFEQLLKQAMGLDVSSIGTSAVERAIEARTRAVGAADADRYWEMLSASPAELQALIEAVVVPETWFFRDREAFAAMVQLLLPMWSIRRAEGLPLRILSLPCSTGEEPYTIAMTLLDAGLPASAFRIDAIDISRLSLAHARRGIYGRNSFRGTDLAYRDRHFTATPQGHRIADAVRASVHFAQGNLFELDLTEGIYDAIFHRNLLIYFDRTDQQRGIAVLRRLLAERGVLFVGHSEASLLLGQGFAPERIPLAFAFRKQEAAAKAVAPVRAVAPPPRPACRESAAAPVRIAPPAPAIARKAAAPEGPTLDDIRALADRGALPAALSLGETYLRAHPAEAESLHLMGVISEAAGDAARATDYYRKTLYLDPSHQEALVHLALLLEKQGDRAGAQRMRDRARRLDARAAG